MGSVNSVSYDYKITEDPQNPYIVDRFVIPGSPNIIMMYHRELESEIPANEYAIKHVYNLVAQTAIEGVSYCGPFSVYRMSYNQAKKYIGQKSYIKYWLFRCRDGRGCTVRIRDPIKIIPCRSNKDLLYSESCGAIYNTYSTSFAMIHRDNERPRVDEEPENISIVTNYDGYLNF